MKVKFIRTAVTMRYGKILAGQVVDVSAGDGAAFVANGVAEKVKEKKKNG